jgi:hypothetical protein
VNYWLDQARCLTEAMVTTLKLASVVMAAEGMPSWRTPELKTNQPGLLQDPQMLRNSRPGAIEAPRDRARGHLAAASVQDGQDGAPGPVAQRDEDRFT